ncbi:MAG: hypothetical protein LBR17_02555 [Bacteroidales bacterium]|jgi:uncharacterized membrane protein YphA (DoxX/SURF4 family)|nr:hypothetical protein [Bacteroidales bacterium]
MKYVVSICRFIFGAVFMLSGFVKAVDPMGTAYKMEEYINVFGMSGWFESVPWIYVVGSVFLCSLEFIIGFMMFFHLFRKWADWLGGLMMLYFTTITLIDALTNQVSDCGCFGDFIKLTNWETFWKNVALDIILLVIIIFSKNRKNWLYPVYSWFLLIIAVLCITGFCIRNIMYEPIIDFRAWKVGNQIILPKAERKPMESYATYRNNQSGEEKEFNMNELMSAYNNDTAFAANWTWLASRVLNPNEVKADGFAMSNIADNEDKTMEFLSQDDTIYIIPCVDLSKVKEDAMKRVLKFIAERNKPSVLITATTPSQWFDFMQKYKISFPVYSTDDKAIKTMVRSDIAVIEMYDGKVLNKWGWRELH